MVDFQFQSEADDCMTQLRMALEHMDGTQILLWAHWPLLMIFSGVYIPPEKHDFAIFAELQQQSRMDIVIDPALLPEAPPSQTTSEQPTLKSNLCLLQPPVFSRQHLPQYYKCVFSLMLNAMGS